jgi:hypothetical protein
MAVRDAGIRRTIPRGVVRIQEKKGVVKGKLGTLYSNQMMNLYGRARLNLGTTMSDYRF